MNFLWGWRTRSFCIFNSEERDGRGCAFTVHFLAPGRRGRAVDSTLAGEEKSAVGLQHRLIGKKCFLHRPSSTLSSSAKVMWKDPHHMRIWVFSIIELVSEDCKLRECVTSYKTQELKLTLERWDDAVLCTVPKYYFFFYLVQLPEEN